MTAGHYINQVVLGMEKCSIRPGIATVNRTAAAAMH